MLVAMPPKLAHYRCHCRLLVQGRCWGDIVLRTIPLGARLDAIGTSWIVERAQQSKYATRLCVYCRHLISSAPRTAFGSSTSPSSIPIFPSCGGNVFVTAQVWSVDGGHWVLPRGTGPDRGTGLGVFLYAFARSAKQKDSTGYCSHCQC